MGLYDQRFAGLYLDAGGAVLNVKHPDFGAMGDGRTDDTAAIQAALRAAGAGRMSTQPRGGVYILSETPVFFPAGHYRISEPLSIGGGTRLISYGAILEQADPEADILRFGDAYDNRVEGLRLVGGRHQMVFRNANTDTTMLKIDQCEFHFSGDYAIMTEGTAAGDPHMSANLSITRSKFIKPRRVLYNVCDYALVRDCWVYVDREHFDADTAAFVSDATNTTTLHFDSMFGVPTMGIGAARVPNVRWVDLGSGAFLSENSRFGGEDAGMAIVYNFAPYGTSHPYATGGYISIRNSPVLLAGPSGRDDSGVVHIRTDVPQFVELVANRYTADTPMIVNSGGLDLAAYLRDVDYAEAKFRFIVGPNMDWGTPGLPPALRRFQR